MSKNPSWVQFSDDAWGEAIGGNSDHNDWLSCFDAPELPTSALDPLIDHNAPLLPAWNTELHAELTKAKGARLYGPHQDVMVYHSGIEREVGRLAAACRASTGMERESNMRQLREAESALSEYCQTPEYRNAVAYSLSVFDAAIKSAGSVLTPEQIAAKGRYAVLRASMEDLLVGPANQQAQPASSDQAEDRPRRKTQSERVEGWLDECERRANSLGKVFDRQDMPGKKADFLALLRRLDPEFLSMKSVESLDRYLKGKCRWSLSANANPDAIPLYAQLFPEAFRLQPGAVLRFNEQHKKS